MIKKTNWSILNQYIYHVILKTIYVNRKDLAGEVSRFKIKSILNYQAR